MQKTRFTPLIVILGILLLVSCSQSSDTKSEGLIQPGDHIGEFEINTAVQGGFIYGFEVTCSEPAQKNTYTCTVRVGDTINVSTGLYDSTGTGKIDQVWGKSGYQMFINDRPVDLAAFGTIDYNHPTVGTIRFANVTIRASKPGEITVRDSGVFDNGDPFESTSTYIFSSP